MYIEEELEKNVGEEEKGSKRRRRKVEERGKRRTRKEIRSGSRWN